MGYLKNRGPNRFQARAASHRPHSRLGLLTNYGFVLNVAILKVPGILLRSADAPLQRPGQAKR
jgi:hypothetical protein